MQKRIAFFHRTDSVISNQIDDSETSESIPFSYELLFRSAAVVGLKPYEVKKMSLAEVNLYVYEKSKADAEQTIIVSWKIINFLKLMLVDKFKDLNEYLPKSSWIGVSKPNNKLIDKAKNVAKKLGHI